MSFCSRRTIGSVTQYYLAVDFVYFVEDPVQNIGVAHHFS